MRILGQFVNLMGLGLLILMAAALVFVVSRGRRQDLPWTPLDLGAPIGRMTRMKLGALADEPGRCQALIATAGVRYATLPDRDDGASCGYRNGVAWKDGGAREARYVPAAPALACPLAASLALWEWQVVQPAAVAHLGQTVTAVEHYGSYACRRIYNRTGDRWSAHAGAAAFDVAGFRLADGRSITIARDWRRADATGEFLHAVRNGGCRLFAVTLSPDYNAAHRDHLHLEQARSGMSWSLCR